MILDRVDQKSWVPVKASRRGPSISHLFFADDLMLFVKDSSEQLEIIRYCLSEWLFSFFTSTGRISTVAFRDAMMGGPSALVRIGRFFGV